MYLFYEEIHLIDIVLRILGHGVLTVCGLSIEKCSKQKWSSVLVALVSVPQSLTY